jgi:hypothetical protein
MQELFKKGEIKMRSSELNVSKFKVLVEALEALPED